MTSAKDSPAAYASPPCFMHEVDPAWSGMSPDTDATGASDVARWRRAERERLLQLRLALDRGQRSYADLRIINHLMTTLRPRPDLCVGLYSPIRGEPRIRALADAILEWGGICALPVVVARNEPLIYRKWQPSDRLEKGFWNIPVPGAARKEVRPDVLIAPVLGFDEAGYRLGNGGGYFDRTLAAWTGTRKVIGVGYDCLSLRTIYPQPHDIPMDLIITESGPRKAATIAGKEPA
ncbi:MAG: 5-formyltetrahydrofolate cyclo-ligase [Minwuia thermotolerans]|nr:MAG: 5-formyltetrahydrofolate cyclo-ligase [Minwuia thermotolerans]